MQATLYLLLPETIVLMMDLVTTWKLGRFVHKIGQISLWVFRLGAYISRISLLPPTFKSLRMTN